MFLRITILICLFHCGIMASSQSSASAIASANIVLSDDQPVIENISVGNTTEQKKNSIQFNIASISISGNNYVYSIISPSTFIIQDNKSAKTMIIDVLNYSSFSKSPANATLEEFSITARPKPGQMLPAGNYFSTTAMEVIVNYN